MKQHDFDFDDAMSVVQFFKKNKVNKGDRKFLLKTDCHPYNEDGTPNLDISFAAIGFATGDTLDNGRPEYTWFVLSRKLEAQGETLDKAFLKEHKEDLMLLEPVDDLKFGIIFLAGGADDWDEL